MNAEATHFEVWRPTDPAPPQHPEFQDIRTLVFKTRDMFLQQRSGPLSEVFIKGGLVVSLIGGETVCGGAEAVLAAFDKAGSGREVDPSAVRDWRLRELVIGTGVAQAVIDARDPDVGYFAVAALCRVDAGWRVASVVFEMV